MARTVMVITNAHLRLGDTAVLTSAPDFACQISSAAINAVPNTQTVPATFCAAESSAPGQTGWEMALTWLQDWSVIPPASLSHYAFENDAELKYFELSATATGPPIATGQCYVVAGSFGGDAGTPLTATATWPLLAKPAISQPVVTGMAAEGQEAEEEAELVEA